MFVSYQTVFVRGGLHFTYTHLAGSNSCQSQRYNLLLRRECIQELVQPIIDTAAFACWSTTNT